MGCKYQTRPEARASDKHTNLSSDHTLMNKLRALIASIRPGLKLLKVINTLAYYWIALIGLERSLNRKH
jgi:hypothetical protein